MLIVRGTKKLRDRVNVVPAGDGDESTTMLGDWFATVLFWRPQVALFVNRRTLLPVFMPLAPAATLLERAPAEIESILRLHGVDDDILASERAAMDEVRVAPTNDRSTVGVMNELSYQGEVRSQLHALRLDELSLEVSRVLLGPLHGDRAGSPDRELARVFGIREPNAIVIPFPAPESTAMQLGPTFSERGEVYQLKVTLDGVNPPVWRRILVEGNGTLDHLHEVIQAAFGWWNYHLHEFEVGVERYGIPDPEFSFGSPISDERRVTLDAIAKAATSFTYTYDFGDDWRHDVTVEKVLPAEDTITVPACIDGRRACPPEDCGGPWGYEQLLAILADPNHPEHESWREWIDGPFDPNRFDPNTFAETFRAVRGTTFGE